MPDEGWVRIYHPDQCKDEDDEVVLPNPDDPEGADNNRFASVTQQSYEEAWKPRGWRNLDEDLAGASAEDMPEKAADRIKWIDEADTLEGQQLRAETVMADEEARDHPRATVLDHAAEVINTSEEDETSITTSEQES